MNKTKLILELPAPLISKIDEYARENGYGTREEAVMFILRYYLDKMDKTKMSMI